MPNILEVAASFRSRVLSEERAAAEEMARAYSEVWQQIQLRLDDLMLQIKDARNSGQQISVSWLMQRNRLKALQLQVKEELRRFGEISGAKITGLQSRAVALGQSGAVETLASAGVTFNRVHTEGVQQIVGFLQDGSPLSSLLEDLGSGSSAVVRKALIGAVATGIGPRLVARRILGDLGGNLTRALTISRTETLRAYRSASILTYQANAEILEGWIWTASLSSRTCAMCIAMHGTKHAIDEPFGSHPNCRCSPVPFFKDPDLNPKIETGEEWFARQPAATKLDILGPEKLAAYSRGDLSLKSVVGFRDDKKWGPTRWEKSLADLNLSSSNPGRPFSDVIGIDKEGRGVEESTPIPRD